MGSRSPTSGDTRTGRPSLSVSPKACLTRSSPNPAMIKAYREGVPGNGKPFPDGSKIAKIQWKAKKSAEAPYAVLVPDTMKDVLLIVKDSKRFPDTGGWGYAQFNYDPASDTFSPEGTGAKCGAACHTIVKAKDYIF